MLRKIKVYGKLRKFCGGQKSFEADISNSSEAISFLVSNFKGIRQHMADQYYVIKTGSRLCTLETLQMSVSNDIQIIPIAHGNIFPLLLGIGLTASTKLIGVKLLGSTLLATLVSNTIAAIGTSMIIDGVTSLISPQQNLGGGGSGMDQLDPSALASNYSFTGLTNISRAGIPVNLVYGEIFVGSITISNGVDTVQVRGES
tara:strand:- start:5764 stop:6366 length:603 start_codon:yes stop_codon:yes gene_type:complete